jgi:t-SNARE complex subunit (syntaxin)
VEAIQSYQTVEQQYRQKYKQRLERQYKIVKPDATQEEIRAAVDDDSGGQVFSQAVRLHLTLCVGGMLDYRLANVFFVAFEH